MIKFFRQSYAIQYVVIALMLVALWLPAFVMGKLTTGLGNPATPLFNLIDGLLDFSRIAQAAFAFLLLVLEALIFNTILINNQIIGKVSTMGAFVFVLLMSLTCTQTQFYPFALATIFILLAIGKLFEIYQLPNSEMNLMKVGVLIALASFCYFPSVLLVVWAFIVLPMAKKGSLRLQLIPVFGFLFVYFLYFVGVFLFGDFMSLMQGYLDYFNSIRFSIEGFNLKTIIVLSLVFVPTVLLMLGSNGANYEKTVSVRVKISMSLILAVFALLMMFLGGHVLMHGLIFIVVSIFVSYAFSYMGNTGWANMFMVVFLILVFANHYYLKLL